MLDYLDHLRTKPIHVRKRIAFVTTAALFLLITSVWWNSWNAESGTPSPERASVAESVVSPWHVVRDTFASAKSSALASFNDAIGQLKASQIEYTTGDNSGSADASAPLSTESARAENSAKDVVVEGKVVYPEDIQAVDTVQTKDNSTASEPLRTRPKTIDAVAATGASR